MDGEHDAPAAAAPGEPAPGEGGAGDAPAIDVAVLAERVYRLMCRELRLERARGASSFGRRTE
jgi:hypothetical protein